MNIDFEKVAKTTEYRASLGPDATDFGLFEQEARDYLEYFDWCLEIVDAYVGIFFAGVVGIFLFRILPSRSDVDEWVWVVVGDIPPAYITCEDAPNAACALDGYIGAMTEWVEAASSGKSVTDLIPVNVPATPENAEALKRRLEFLDEKILSSFQDDLVVDD